MTIYINLLGILYAYELIPVDIYSVLGTICIFIVEYQS